jgi:hypothetical protein
MYGGIMVPPSFFMRKNIKEIDNPNTWFVCETYNDDNVSYSNLVYSTQLMGSNAENPELAKYIYFYSNELKKDFVENYNFDMNYFKKNNIPYIDGRMIGTKTRYNDKITIEELKLKLLHHYDPSIIHKYSSALDIIACFIKAQSFLYNESSNYCKYRLNLLMFPCIFLSTLCSVFSSVSQRVEYGILIIGGVNAVVAFLLAIVNYLKLDAAAEAHHISSNHFSRLKILLEFTSGETLLFENPLLQQNGLEKEVDNWSRVHDPEDMEEQKLIYKNNVNERIKDLQDNLIKSLQTKINAIKERVIEIRENNRFAIPQAIIDHYPIIFNINIFSFIKTVEDYRMGIISSLKNILNEIRFLNSKQMTDSEKERVKALYLNKNYIINELIMLTSTHNLIEVLFQQTGLHGSD